MKEPPWFCINTIIWCCCGLGEASASDRNSLTQCSCPSSEVPSPLQPPVGFSFRPYEPLKEPWSLKSFKAEVSKMRSRKGGGKKTWTRLKDDFVFWQLGLPKRVSLGRQLETGWWVKEEWWEFVFFLGRGGWGEMWITASGRKRSLPWFAGVPHCGNATGLSRAPLVSGYKEGISSVIYWISCHVGPKMAPSPLLNCPVSLCGWLPQFSSF